MKNKNIMLGMMLSLIMAPSLARAEASCKAQCDEYRSSSKNDPTLWNQVGPHCEALDLLGQGKNASLRSGTAYTAAAAVCGGGCLAKNARDTALVLAEEASQELMGATITASACVKQKALALAAEAVAASSSVATAAKAAPLGAAAQACGSATVTLDSHISASTLPHAKWTEASNTLKAADSLQMLNRGPALGNYNASSETFFSTINTNTQGASAPITTCDSAASSSGALAAANPCSPLTSQIEKSLAKFDFALQAANTKVEYANGLSIACEIGGVSSGLMDIAESVLIKDAVAGFLRGTAVAGLAGTNAAGLTKSVGAKVGLKDDYSGSCVAAGVLAAAAATRFYSMNTSKESEQKECGTISRYASLAAVNTPQMALAPKPLSNGSGLSGAGRASNQLSGLNMSSQEATNNFPKNLLPQQGAAKADPFAKIFDRMPNSNKIPDALAKMGGGLEGIAGALDSGNSPGSILAAALGGASPQMAGEFRNLDASVAKYMKVDSAGTSVASSGNGRSGGKGPDLGFGFGNLFGAKGAEGGGPTDSKSMSFGRGPASAGEADIWHSSSPGTIFQIVSSKISATRDRVEDLDWVTPINRAMAGGMRSKSK
ncbi:MAG: hypothetical protein AABZ55_09535 [Bdellovibrionota bacterium]